MEEITIRNGDEFIKLGQAIKAAGFVESGVEATERSRHREAKSLLAAK